jgi:hypothetical protein
MKELIAIYFIACCLRTMYSSIKALIHLEGLMSIDFLGVRFITWKEYYRRLKEK